MIHLFKYPTSAPIFFGRGPSSPPRATFLQHPCTALLAVPSFLTHLSVSSACKPFSVTPQLTNRSLTAFFSSSSFVQNYLSPIFIPNLLCSSLQTTINLPPPLPRPPSFSLKLSKPYFSSFLSQITTIPQFPVTASAHSLPVVFSAPPKPSPCSAQLTTEPKA